MAAAAASPAAATTTDITGVWREASLHNLEEFLKGMGVGWIKRKAATQLIKLKTQTQTVLYDHAGQVITISVVGKPSGDEQNTVNIGRPTVVAAKLTSGEDSVLTLNLAWSEDGSVLINDFVGEKGRLIVKRSMVGAQMKVECCHVDSGKAMWRMFDRIEAGKTVRLGEDGKLVALA
jgi:hypothetical protein